MTDRTAVVTGAAGFIGAHVGTALAVAGWDVVGVDVRAGEAAWGGQLVVGDVAEDGSWLDIFGGRDGRGVDLVVHTAAVVAEAGDRARFEAVNVGGTRRVCGAAAAAAVGRVVHLSSIVVYGSDFTDGVTEDEAALRPTGGPYTDTKVASELVAREVLDASATELVIVRPGDVYGPGSVPWTLRPMRMIKRRQLTLVDGGRGVLSPIFIDDLVRGIVLACEHPDAAGETFNLASGKGVTAAEFFGHYADAAGRRLPSLPVSVARFAARVAVVAAGLVGREAPFSPEALEYVTHPGTYSIAKAEAVLGWTPQISLDEGMKSTLAWLREVGEL